MQNSNKLYLGFLLVCMACGQPAEQPEKTSQMASVPMKWMMGHWEMRTDSTLITENWEQVSADLCTGEAWVIAGADTVLHEGLQLKKEGNNWIYLATINDNEPVPFKLNSKSDPAGEVVFENPEHDFPQYVRYVLVSDDEILAEVGGTEKGKEQKETFNYKRVR